MTNGPLYPKVSLCVITERRPEFMPFLAHCWNHLDWPGEKELAVVTTIGNEESLEVLGELVPKHEQNFDITLKPGQYVGQLRTRATHVATGDWITWADDDDWFGPHRLREVWEVIMTHPQRRHIKVMGMATDVPLLHLGNLRMKPRPRGAWWAGGFVERELAASVRFLKLNVGEDGAWFIRVCQMAEREHPQAVQRMATRGDMILCLAHGRNISVGSDCDKSEYWPLPVPEWLDEASYQAILDVRERLGISGESLQERRRRP
jgi:hypothetical protein